MLENVTWFEIVTISGLGFLLLKDKVSMLFRKLFSAKKIKAAGVELEFGNIDEQSAQTLKTMWSKFDNVVKAVEHNKDMTVSKVVELCEKVDVLHTVIGSMKQKMDGMFVDQLKLMFVSDRLNTEERMFAGLKYVNLGYNHEIKADVIEYARQNIEMYCGITKGVPNLKLAELEKETAKKCK